LKRSHDTNLKFEIGVDGERKEYLMEVELFLGLKWERSLMHCWQRELRVVQT